LGAKFQNWINRNFWEFSGSYDGLPTINGTILQSLFSGDNLTDENITVRGALRISTVFTCINVRGKTLASLPLNVFKSEGGKTEKLSDHPTYYALSQEPNDYMTAANFWLTIMLHFDAWGNAFVHINRDSRQRPSTYDILEPWEVTIKKSEGNLYYDYKGERYSSWDVLHFRGYSYNGICGISPILENADTMGMAKKLDRYAALTLGSRPPGILSYEGNLTPEAKAENKKEFQTGGVSTVKILSGRWKYDPIMNQADQTQFIQAKSKNQNDIYGIYQIPPTFAQNFERATFSNAEQSDLVYAKHTVTPIVTNFEKEMNMKVFYEREKSTHYVKFNMNGLLRGDLAARKEFYQSMVNTGVMNRNEARDLEDLNPYAGGDDFLVQGAMAPADLLRKKYEKELLPTAEPVKKHLNGHTVFN
jgi:HK97 family phage portal protein